MVCPNCKKETLEKINFDKVEVNRCTQCHGIWFNQDELRKSKDEKDQYLKWLDIDLWKEGKKFQVSSSGKMCPLCKETLYEVRYGESDIKVDTCISCKGIWLDEGEFKKIIAYLKNIVGTETLNKYLRHTFEEAKEIFAGPEGLSSEVEDFLLVIKLLEYRFYSQYPIIGNIIINLPFSK